VSGPSISELTSAVMDTGRRGEPKPGCDCVQCFGYCLVDADQAVRLASLNRQPNRLPSWAPLVFEDGS
jgi:hypothetical protein